MPSSRSTSRIFLAPAALALACSDPASGNPTAGPTTLGSATGGSTTAPAETDSPSTSGSATVADTTSATDPSTGGSTSPGDSGDSSDSTGTPEPLEPYPDLSLGPYPSLLTLATDSMLAQAEALDTGATYSHSAAQGYVLQAIGELLWDARDYDLPARPDLVDAALGEIAELQASDDQVLGGGPGFGLDYAWDAFGDGSDNPAFTAYTWQSGMVALGVAKIARVLEATGHPQAADVRDYGVALVQRWDAHYTSLADGGFWWYSTQPSDAIAVHNTSALVAMASQILAEAGAPAMLADRPPAAADLLWARMSGNPTAGYVWHYADDGYPAPVGAEDVSHALVTLQLMAEARARDWWSNSQMQGVAQTLLSNMWSGHPARLHGFVDGSSGGDSEWAWSRAAVIGYAVHGDAQGGDPAVFDYARSLLFSSYLSRFERALQGSTVDSARTLAVALLLTHRPAAFPTGSAWEMVAGPGDDAIPRAPGGVRFYTVDWAAPAELDAGLVLPARQSTAANPNLLVDLPEGAAGPVVVSLIYRSSTSGSVGQWDGNGYQDLAPLPATVDDEGTVRWMRTSVMLDPSIAFDYQAGVAGLNVLLQLQTSSVAVHRIEATPL